MTETPFAHWRSTAAQRQIEDTTPEMGILPPVFQFSQNNLQDYADCARRFQLRYALGQAWPAVESEPVEEQEHFIEQGEQFHLLIQRHLMGVPEEKLTPADPLLKGWWENYLKTSPPDLPAGLRLPELQLSTPLGSQRLLARFDLLAIDPSQRAVIVDWKTTRKRPRRQILADRLQTRVYPFVLVEAGAELFGGPIQPEQVSLIYWFAEAPNKPEMFEYDTNQHKENRKFLSRLVAEVEGHDEEIWPLTEDTNHCKYCVYRSLCDRGVKAGDFREVDFETDETDFEIDLDSVEEIAF